MKKMKIMDNKTGKIFEAKKMTAKIEKGIENGTYKMIWHPDYMTDAEINFVKKFIVKGN